MKTFLIRGVPTSLQRDGWWMDAAIPPRYPDDHAPPRRRRARWPLLLARLIALADVLLWQAIPGLSLAVFALGLLGAAPAG